MKDEEREQAEAKPNRFQDELSAYRQSLISAEQAMQAAYDKGVMTLSGGALGISFAFLKDIVGTKNLTNGGWLLGAWILWGLSISFVLISFFTSTKALRKALNDTDTRAIYATLAKSGWVTATKWLNGLAGAGFIAGVIFLVVFVAYNLPE